MNLNSVVSIPANVMARRVGEEVVVLDLSGGQYFGLPVVGGRIWELLVDGKSLREASEVIASEFEVDPLTAERDLVRLVEDLCCKGLLVTTDTMFQTS